MQLGKILYAEHHGAYIIKMMGDVRLTVCAALDEFLDQMFSHPRFKEVVVDLTETEGIDSTTLGILAKLSIQAKKQFQFIPVIYSSNNDITRILVSMGFDEVFDIQRELTDKVPSLGELVSIPQSEDQMRQHVIAAHRTLMALNASNELKFHDLVSNLEASGTKH